MPVLRIDIDVAAVLADLVARAENLEPALDQIGEYLQLTTRDRFDREVDPDGNKWQSLKPATIARKEKKKLLRGILTAKGLLRDTFSYRVSGNTIEFGTSQNYGIYHQQPDGPGKGIIPRRAFLGVNAEDEKEIETIVRDYLLNA